jgi:hypothetical protein
VFNSDLAFWGDRAYQGTYDGFRIVDITAPANPKTLNNYDECFGNQGDVIVWNTTLIRSWNSPAPVGATCDGEAVPQGWEGVHVFDVSNAANPDLVGAVQTPCGSHTETAVPDLANNRLLIYNNFLGKHVMPRPQTLTENCTVHNYNVVPTSGRRVLVHGSYQSGIGVVDFTDPTNAVEIAYADPAPLPTTQLVLGGDWSSYWYDGRIYESDITRGLIVWELSDPAVARAQQLGHLNPQTQEFTLG